MKDLFIGIEWKQLSKTDRHTIWIIFKNRATAAGLEILPLVCPTAVRHYKKKIK